MVVFHTTLEAHKFSQPELRYLMSWRNWRIQSLHRRRLLTSW